MIELVFDSMSELRNYVLNVMDDCAIICADEMLEIMRKEIDDQVYGEYSPSMYVRTMDLSKTPIIISADRTGMHTEFADNGGWFSLYGQAKGHHFFPLYGLEQEWDFGNGGTWGRGRTQVRQQSINECFIKIPDKYKEVMNAFGIPTI